MSLLNIPLLSLLGLGVISLGLLLFTWVATRWWCRPKRIPTNETPIDYNLPGESITFDSHGSKLKGWFLSQDFEKSPGPVIILSHGWSHNASKMLPVAKTVYQKGFRVLLYDARGHGMSENGGPITILKMAEDVIAAVDYLKTRSDVDTKQIGVIGHSIGGGSAILASSLDSRIQALVCSSAFADPASLIRNYFIEFKGLRSIFLAPFIWLVSRIIEHWLGTTMENVAPQYRIGLLSIPVLLIHGGSDSYISPSNMDVLYGRSDPHRTERLLLPGLRHSEILTNDLYAEGIDRFLTANFLYA